jgi:cellulose synthase/poly-beta-1,6-N-acetylglucosamine synthase-like glycosyltransferase
MVFSQNELSLWLSTALFAVTLPILAVYAARLYAFALMALGRKPTTEIPVGAHGDPLVTVLLPVYNEERVIDRLMGCCTSFDHDDYEVIVVDDSTDSTPAKLARWAGDEHVRIIHRKSREGWKGGALNEGLRAASPDSKYCIVLDADSAPDPDLLDRYLVKMEETGVRIVQGRQKPDLNEGESWVSRAASMMLDAYHLNEMSAKQRLALLVPITGSNFMARTELLRECGFGMDIAEDWDLTAKLCAEGIAVTYDPSLCVRSESPATLRAALRQLTRWAEGMSRGTSQRANDVVRSRRTTAWKKVDFFMTGFSYCAPLLYLVVQLAEILLAAFAFSHPSAPFVYWGTVVGLLSLPAISFSLAAASLVSRRERKLESVLSAILEAYIAVPFTAYGSLKGLLRSSGVFTKTDRSGWVRA